MSVTRNLGSVSWSSLRTVSSPFVRKLLVPAPRRDAEVRQGVGEGGMLDGRGETLGFGREEVRHWVGGGETWTIAI